MKKEIIPINIWDDFYDDGYEPEGEIQETYIYVEDYDIPHEKCKEYLEILLNYMKNNLTLEGVELNLLYHDTINDYPEENVKRCIETYGESFFFKRYEINVKYLTHERLDILVNELNVAKLSVDNMLFDIYSES